ncbi:uncharacterized protein ASCRUDRAFT_8267 [Ascoidea rubescens DSM 1968]|uniref:Uncharacterized protein n=1 Tax=Ascoidea rubescens DSM 1968 TaxID=1344418 RepID=A0A1D2VG43_9ASCO|nr:hypothetical protein ASCRUDRAFT_8267 [Ascoidea rubescens DSM 1968]ODV60648.1 hypothetical protein ASCRUDRAFT_8267 [Ascoidea rubescens DSM 1968]
MKVVPNSPTNLTCTDILADNGYNDHIELKTLSVVQPSLTIGESEQIHQFWAVMSIEVQSDSVGDTECSSFHDRVRNVSLITIKEIQPPTMIEGHSDIESACET